MGNKNIWYGGGGGGLGGYFTSMLWFVIYLSTMIRVREYKDNYSSIDIGDR